MLNLKLTLKILGGIALCEALILFGCTVIAFCYGEDDTIPFVYSTFIALGIGLTLQYLGRRAEKVMNRRDGYIVVCTSWILSTFLGLFPYLFSEPVVGFSNALFESMSGFTSTGSTIIDNIDDCPHALLFWRSLTQWIGGVGIVLFTLALLPGINMGNVQLFAAQCTGPLRGKLQPRIASTIRWILAVYVLLTVACAFCLFFFGNMGWFDAVNHAFTCIGTGGFSTHQQSIAFYGSRTIEYILIIFMFLAGTNYNLLYFFGLRGKFKRLFNDTEFRYYTVLFLGLTLICAVPLCFYNKMGAEEAVRVSAFQIIATLTSTGFCSHDYMGWASWLLPFIFLAMIIGGCSGSSAGGYKVIRVAMLQKLVRNEIKKIVHPNAVFPLRINSQVIATPIKILLVAFTALLLGTFCVGWVALMICGLNFDEAAICCISALSNAGPAYGAFGPAFSWNALSDGAKWISSGLMFVGRLELLSVYVVFTRNFWKRH